MGQCVAVRAANKCAAYLFRATQYSKYANALASFVQKTGINYNNT